MHGWIKHFVDGTKEIGTDFDARMKRVSWSRGRLTGMIAAEIIHGNKRMAIISPGRFWQSDDYEVNIYEPTPSLRVRRLQRQIRKEDHMMIVQREADSIVVNVSSMYLSNAAAFDLAGYEGKWITIEYNLQTRKFKCGIEENMI